MKSMYEPISRKKRAANYRRNAMECERAGFSMFAEINVEMAAIMDPPPRSFEVQPLRGEKRPSKRMEGAGSNARRAAQRE